MARPTNDPKPYRVNLRINAETNEKLKKKSEELNTTIAEYVRSLIDKDIKGE